MALFILFIHSLMAMATIRQTQAVEYGVTNIAVEYSVTNNAAGTPGGTRFQNEIGSSYTLQTLQTASSFIWKTFKQSEADRKSVNKVTTIIDAINGVAYVSNDVIHVSADYIAGYSGNVREEVTGLLYHEMVHVWQWNGNGQAVPGRLIDGIADYVRLKAGYVPSYWRKPGQGERWDTGYDVTALFLDYCNSLRDGFVADLNKKMRTGYTSNFFVELLGKSVDQLWTDYKAKYPGS